VSQLQQADWVRVVMIVCQRSRSPAALVVLAAVIGFAAAAPMAVAAGWSTVGTPKDSFLDALSCRSTSWCMGVGAWRKGLTAAIWNARRW
jgi:hypothetical protein